MIEERVWICPSLCGCELNMTGDWVKDTDRDGLGRAVSYQHPKPGSITAVFIVAACSAHDHYRTDPPIADQTHGGQMRGYLLRAPATEAERLYVALTRYTGQVIKPDTCVNRACCIYQSHDRTSGVVTIQQHLKHSRKCTAHLADDDQHSAALENNSRKNRALTRIRELDTALTDNDFAWSYDALRILHVSARALSVPRRIAAQTWCDTTLGVGKVVVE